MKRAKHMAPGWYGKLPAMGDFLHQRMPEALIAPWNHWFQQGLLLRQNDDHATTAGFMRAPVWNFVLPVTPGTRQVQLGCLLPSHDRVGRIWPLLALHSMPVERWHPAQLRISGEWFDELGATLLHAVQDALPADALERLLQNQVPLMVPETQPSDIMDVIGYADLPCTLSWREVAEDFNPRLPFSYWWSNRSDGFPHATHKHGGSLTAELFTLLFNPAAGAKPGRNGLYPPMFE